MEVSVVLPCLNEEKTVAVCIEKSLQAFKNSGIAGEVIVVDNGSTDNSAKIAKSCGARVVFEQQKGYGSALRRGVDESQGKYIVMGDIDNTYDFLDIPKFVEKLRAGDELVMGSRFRGKIMPGAMTWSHRYIGNPVLSGMLRLFFGGNVSDSHCGLRAFSKEAYKKMGLHTTGMEFASEMVIHALKKKLKIGEIPITYYFREGESKLSSFRDAWRHIRFMLLYSPNYLYLLPGAIIFFIGLALTIRLMFGPIWFAGRNWDIHVIVFSSFMAMLGWQVVNTGLAAKIYAHQIGLEESSFTKWMLSVFTLERTLFIGLVFLVTGIGVCLYIFILWVRGHFGFGIIQQGEWAQIKTAILAITFVMLGIQTIFSSFLYSTLQIKYK